MTIKPIKSSELIPLVNWARDYHRHNRYPCDAMRRFAIGFYQIFQAISWRDNAQNRAESLASASIHFLICMEASSVFAERRLPRNLIYIETVPMNCERVLFHASRAQQMLVYGAQWHGTSGLVKTIRSSRYKAGQLEEDLSACVSCLIGAIPSHQREQAIEDATRIMTERL